MIPFPRVISSLIGHSHPKVVKAIAEQAEKGIHFQANVGVHKPMLELSKRLQKVLPPEFDRFFYTNSGAEAVENAIKIARSYTKRQNVIAFHGGFHGRTFGTLSITSSKSVYKKGFGPLMAGAHTIPYPKKGLSIESYVADLEHFLKTESDVTDTAAFILEPLQGEGGYVYPDMAFMKALRQVCNDNGILLIADEVQSGFCRTGKFWAFEHFDIVPDLVVMAKGIASGLPLSCVASPSKYMENQVPGSMGGTYSGNVVSCAAAIATMDILEEENILENVNRNGKLLFNGLESLQSNEKFCISEVRGKGLMVAIQFSPEGGKGVAGKVAAKAISKGLLLMTAGPLETIRFMPPLTVSKEEVEMCLDILKSVLEDQFQN